MIQTFLDGFCEVHSESSIVTVFCEGLSFWPVFLKHSLLDPSQPIATGTPKGSKSCKPGYDDTTLPLMEKNQGQCKTPKRDFTDPDNSKSGCSGEQTERGAPERAYLVNSTTFCVLTRGTMLDLSPPLLSWCVQLPHLLCFNRSFEQFI